MREEELFVENLEGIDSTFVSDRILNLPEEVEGKFREEKGKKRVLIDRYLALPAEEKINFRLGRSMWFYRRIDDLSDPVLRRQVEEVLGRIEKETSGGVEKMISDLMGSFI
jgi:hypothetical protein